MATADEDYDFFKVIVIGDVNVGKTSLIKQFCENKFDLHTRSTVGVDFKICDTIVRKDNQDYKVKLQVWDTAGEEKYKSLTSTFYRNADAAVIVFDISREVTFQSVSFWLKSVHQYCPRDIYTILVGNKCDLSSNIDDTKIENFWYQHDLYYFETSAKSSYKVEETFQKLASDLLSRNQQVLHLPSLDNQGLDSLWLAHQENNKQIQSGYCCYYF